MRAHDPVWWGNKPSEWDYYSYYNTEQESSLKQMLGALCRASGTEPNPTYLHSYLHGNPAAQSLSFFSPALKPSLSFCPLILPASTHLHPLAFPAPLSSPPLAFWNRINFDQSNVQICLAEETVTYWRRFAHAEMKKARRPISQNISGVTQTFTHTLYI